MFSGTLDRDQREVGNFNPMQLLEINLIMLVLALLPSNLFHPRPDGMRSLKRPPNPFRQLWVLQP